MSFDKGSEKQIVCLDPSCFTSVERLRDTKHLLNEIRNDYPTLEVYVPTKIQETILLPPPEKFKILPDVLEGWFGDESIEVLDFDEKQKEDYTYVMREFLELHDPKPVQIILGDIQKIGKESIHLEGLRKLFGIIKAKILLEVMGISSEFKAQIIALNERTFSMMSNFGTEVKRGISKVKQELKERARIRTNLYVAMMFMEYYGIPKFVENFQIQGVNLPLSILPAVGMIYLANG